MVVCKPCSGEVCSVTWAEVEAAAGVAVAASEAGAALAVAGVVDLVEVLAVVATLVVEGPEAAGNYDRSRG